MNRLSSNLRVAFCFLWTALMITSSLLVLIITFSRKIPVVMARTMFAPGILWGCGVKLEINGVENLDEHEPYIFISNHLSYLDIPVLFRVIPHNLHFVAKKQIKYVPFVGWYMATTGMIFVDRTNRVKARESMLKAGQLIRNGKDVLMFPEGTRSKDGKLQEFKKGAFVLAQNSGVSIVPVALSGTEKVLAPGGFLVKPGKVKVNIGQPIPYNHPDFHSFSNESRNRLQELKVAQELQLS